MYMYGLLTLLQADIKLYNVHILDIYIYNVHILQEYYFDTFRCMRLIK